MRKAQGIALPVLALAALLGGCKREPDFDERYDAASKSIVDKAKAIDAQVAGTGAPPAGADGEADPAER
jgi:PBP1b-binding outer membrane lipoprotein LpoB